jgi:hypothetical protein
MLGVGAMWRIDLLCVRVWIQSPATPCCEKKKKRIHDILKGPRLGF